MARQPGDERVVAPDEGRPVEPVADSLAAEHDGVHPRRHGDLPLPGEVAEERDETRLAEVDRDRRVVHPPRSPPSPTRLLVLLADRVPQETQAEVARRGVPAGREFDDEPLEEGPSDLVGEPAVEPLARRRAGLLEEVLVETEDGLVAERVGNPLHRKLRVGLELLRPRDPGSARSTAPRSVGHAELPSAAGAHHQLVPPAREDVAAPRGAGEGRVEVALGQPVAGSHLEVPHEEPRHAARRPGTRDGALEGGVERHLPDVPVRVLPGETLEPLQDLRAAGWRQRQGLEGDAEGVGVLRRLEHANHGLDVRRRGSPAGVLPRPGPRAVEVLPEEELLERADEVVVPLRGLAEPVGLLAGEHRAPDGGDRGETFRSQISRLEVPHGERVDLLAERLERVELPEFLEAGEGSKRHLLEPRIHGGSNPHPPRPPPRRAVMPEERNVVPGLHELWVAVEDSRQVRERGPDGAALLEEPREHAPASLLRAAEFLQELSGVVVPVVVETLDSPEEPGKLSPLAGVEEDQRPQGGIHSSRRQPPESGHQHPALRGLQRTRSLDEALDQPVVDPQVAPPRERDLQELVTTHVAEDQGQPAAVVVVPGVLRRLFEHGNRQGAQGEELPRRRQGLAVLLDEVHDVVEDPRLDGGVLLQLADPVEVGVLRLARLDLPEEARGAAGDRPVGLLA